MKACQIRVNPFEFIEIIEYRAFKKENEHGLVTVTGFIQNDLENTYVEMALQEVWAQVVAFDETGEDTILFTGIVTDLSVRTENDVKTLSVEIRSGTYLMDQMQHIRTYQDIALTYKDVLKSFTDEYMNSGIILTKGKGQAIDKLMIQYRETDWEFMKRIASHLNTVIVPDFQLKGVHYFFGLPERKTVEVNTKFYSMKKKVNEYTEKKKNGLNSIREKDAIYYIIKQREIYDLGTSVILNGRQLYVSSIQSELEGSEVYHTYFLKTQAGFQVPKTYNLRGIGASLAANVTKVRRDTVQLAVQEDENQEKAGFIDFLYSTVYSTPDGTGWYCMPEIGDEVRLYIPSQDEPESYVISSTHLRSSAGDERVNPDYKSIMNKYHKEILFKPDSLTLTNNAGMSIEILDKEGIRITSNKSIIIKAKKSVQISSASSTLKVVAPKSILLNQGGTRMQLSDDIVFKGAQIHMD